MDLKTFTTPKGYEEEEFRPETRCLMSAIRYVRKYLEMTKNQEEAPEATDPEILATLECAYQKISQVPDDLPHIQVYCKGMIEYVSQQFMQLTIQSIPGIFAQIIDRIKGVSSSLYTLEFQQNIVQFQSGPKVCADINKMLANHVCAMYCLLEGYRRIVSKDITDEIKEEVLKKVSEVNGISELKLFA